MNEDLELELMQSSYSLKQGGQGGLNKKEIQLNLSNISSILILDELYLFA